MCKRERYKKPTEVKDGNLWNKLEESSLREHTDSAAVEFVTKGELRAISDGIDRRFEEQTAQILEMFSQLRYSMKSRHNSRSRSVSNGSEDVGPSRNVGNKNFAKASPIDAAVDASDARQKADVADTSPARLSVDNELQLSPTKVQTVKSFCVMLKEAMPAAIVQFKEDAATFEAKYAERVKVAFSIEKDLATSVCLKHKPRLERSDFLKLPNEDVYKLLFAYAIPETAMEWRRAFEKSVKLARSKNTHDATPTDFDKHYMDMQIFITSFKEIYNYMLPDNVDQIKRVVPPFMGAAKIIASNSENGVSDGATMVNIFMDLCPGGYGKDWNRLIFPYGFKEVKEVKDINSYLDHLLRRIMEYQVLSVELRPLADFMGRKSGKHNHFRNFREAGFQNRQQVNQVTGAQILEDSDYDSQFQSYESSESVNDDSSVGEESYEPMEPVDDNRMYQLVPTSVKACFKMVDKGQCEGVLNGKCSYSHDNDIVLKALPFHSITVSGIAYASNNL